MIINDDNKKICINCKWCDDYFCKRHSPVVNQYAHQDYGVWPRINLYDEFCGDFEIKEKK